MKLQNPIILALDVDDSKKALSLAKQIGPLVGALKIGPRLSLRYGTSFVEELAGYAPVFLDHKYFDIPSTMREAVRASFEMGASLVTVHALAGSAALKELAGLEIELSQSRPFRLLAVTILTSWKDADLPPNFLKAPIASHVEQLAQTAVSSGIRGLVCSPHEVQKLRSLARDAFIVTPGIRFATDSSDDQKRVMSPREAIENGASALVVGRTILESQDAKATTLRILEEIQ